MTGTNGRGASSPAWVTAGDGTRIAVHLDGTPSAAPPLVLLHGVGSSSLTYQWLRPLVGADRQTVCIDFRGHGSSGRAPGTYTLPHYAADVVTVLEQLVQRPALVAGFSLGGMVGWKLAQERPDLLVAVLLEEPIVFTTETNAGPLPRILQHTIDQEVDWVRRGVDVPVATHELGTNPAGPGLTLADVLHPDGLRGLAVSTMVRDRGTIEAAIDATMVAGIDTSSTLRVPAVIVAGADERGSVFPTHDAAVVARTHPEIVVHRVPGAGHDLHNSLAGRDAYLTHLQEFLSSNTARVQATP